MSSNHDTGVDETGLAGMLLIVGWSTLLGVTATVGSWAVALLGAAFVLLGFGAPEIRDRWVLRVICGALGASALTAAAMFAVSAHAHTFATIAAMQK